MFRANDTLFILRLRIQALIDHSPLASGELHELQQPVNPTLDLISFDHDFERCNIWKVATAIGLSIFFRIT